MVDFLIETLKPLGYPIKRQGSMLADEQYPDSFFTFWNNSTNDDAYYDNENHTTIWDFDVNAYSTDPDTVEKMLLKAKQHLINNGFIIDGKGHDVASDEITHTGRGFNAQIIES